MLLALLSLKAHPADVIIGTSTTNYENVIPAYGYYRRGWSAIIIDASELSGPGTITQLLFHMQNSVNYSFANQTVYMVSTTNSTFSSSAYENPTSLGATQVFTGTVSFTSSGGAFQGITLQSPYNYTGGNLMILWENRRGSYSSGYPRWYYTTTTGNKAKFTYTDSSFPTGNGSYAAYRPNMKIVYTPANAIDLTVSDWVFPQTGASASSAMPISIKVKNAGGQAQSNYTVKYSIDNGSTWASQTVGSSISPGNSQNITFITPANMSTPGTYQCIAVVKKTGDTVVSNDTLRQNITICSGGYAGTYQVGSSSSADFPDLESAFDAFNSCGLTSSVNLKLEAGTYTGEVIIPYINGLSATKTLTIETLSGQKDVVLTSTTTNTSHFINQTVRLDSARFVTLKNLKITVSDNSGVGAHALLFDGAQHCKVQNCIVEGVNGTSSTSDAYSTIYYGNSTNSYAHNIILESNQIKYGSYGIYSSGTSGYCYGHEVLGNNISDYYFIGMQMNYNDSIQVKNNTISTSSTAGNNNLYLYRCYYGIDVSGNKIETFNNSGIYLYYCYGSSSAPNKIYNNWIYGYPISSNYIYGIYSYYSNNLIIDYNSINITNPNSYSSTTYGMYMRSSTITSLRNNSILNGASGYAFYNYSSTISNFDYNNLYTNGNYLAYYNGNRTNLSALQSASSTNANSVSSTGVYYTYDNLHSNSSSLNNEGTAASVITTDIDGQNRSTTAPDIGADEFDIIPNDGGLVSFSNMTNQCAGTQVPIIVSLKNFGTTALTSAYVHVDLGSTSLGSYWNGYLSPGSSSDVFLGLYTFSSDTAYNIVAMLDSVNGAADLNHYNDTVWLNGYRTSLDGTFTVGSGGDFSDISDAINGMRQYGVCGPVVFDILPGTYNGSYVLDNTISGVSSSNTVTFQSSTGDTADVSLIRSSATSSDNYIFQIQNTGYYRFKGLSLQSIGTYYNTVFEINSSEDIIIDSCLMVHSSSSSSSYSRSVNAQNSNDIRISHSTLVNPFYGVYFSGSSSQDVYDLEVSNNEILNFYSYGIYASYTDTLKLEKNKIYSQNTPTYAYGIYLYYADREVDVNANDIKVSGTTDVYGVYLNYCNYSSYVSSPNIDIYNNFINATTTGSNEYAMGLYIYRVYYPKFYFNSIKAIGLNTYSAGVYTYYGYYMNSRNNIISSNYYALYRYYGSFTSSDYNNYYTTGSYIARLNSSQYSTFSSFKSASGMESHSKNVDPGFLAADDLHIFNQYLNDAGSPYGGVTVDIDGETRSTYLPDIGADEFSLLGRDVYPLAVNSPANPAAIGQNDVKVSIKNQGLTTLYSCNIFYRLDGGSIDSNYWTGNLGFLSVDSLINLGTVTLSAGNHTLEVWTKNPNGQVDQNASNDTLVYQFSAIPKPIISVAPTTLTDVITVCNGTSSKNLTIYNTGSANLNVSIPSNTSGGGNIQILAILTGYYSSAYTNTKSVIQSNISNAVITETSTTSATTLASLLPGKDIVLIPRISSTSSTYLNAYTNFASHLQSFVNSGGTVIFLGSQGTSANAIWNTGLFTGSYYGYLNSGYSVSISQLSHPIFDGFTSSSFTTNYYYTRYTITNTDDNVLATYSGSVIATERSIGQGKAILLGFDNYYTSTPATDMLVNAIEYGASQGDFVQNNAITQVIAPGDSAIVTVSFDADGLTNGWHEDEVIINHNDQSQASIHVPCSLYVDGQPEFSVYSYTHSLGSIYQGTTLTDSVYFFNTGCADLYITGVASNNSALTPLQTQDTIAPGDSAVFHFEFSPQTVGSYIMNVTVFNNDSTKIITFAGSASPSPQIAFNPNPLNATIVNCGDSVIKQVYIKNTGGATLTGSVASTSSSDSLEVLMLTYGGYASSISNLANNLDYTFDKFNLTQENITSVTQLQSSLQGKDVVIIPYINSSSYLTTYNSFTTTLQNFVSNGGVIMWSGQYTGNYITNSGFFSGTYAGYQDYVNATVNTTHPITSGFSSSIYIGNEDFLYYSNMTSTSNFTSLITYGTNYTISGIRSYGDGYAIYLGFGYYSVATPNYQYQIASNALEFAYDNKNRWMDVASSSFTINPGDSSMINVKFLSTDLATGQYYGDLKFNTNVPGNANTNLPCTLNVLNELDATSFLGPDSAYCGPQVLDAGSGYSSYTWNTGASGQTLTANWGGYYMVTITDGAQCMSRDTVLLTIHPNPTATITGLPSSACTNGSGIQMTGSPSGGGFIGNGVSGSTFYPATVSTGPHNITYTYTNSYGCTDTEVQTVTVYNPPTVLATGLNASYCPQGTPSNLIGAPSGGSFSGNGMSGSTFNPYFAGPGNHNILYTYTDNNGCSNTDTISTTVFAATSANITGYQSDMCINDTAVSLSSSISGTTYSGNGMSGNVFTPSSAGVGTHNIIYNYTDANTCSYQDTLEITVHGLPSGVSISGLGSQYCIDAGSVPLSGYPLGGAFSGPGMSGNSFNTQTAGAGNHTIVYTYTDVYGCSNSDTDFVQIHALPTITFNNLNSGYCIDNGNVLLTANPVGGSFTGNGVIGASFNPQMAGLGSHYITYSVTDNNSCYNQDSIMIAVNPLPTVNLSGLPANVCSNAAPITLSGSPASGTLSGSGVSGMTFNPATAGNGQKVLTYTYTDNNGCTSSDEDTVTVVQTQQVNIGPNQSIANNTSTQFNPIVTGGTGSFSYAWSPSNMLTNPNILNPTTVALTQTTLFSLLVTDNNSGCVASDSALVQVTGGSISATITPSSADICNGDQVGLQVLASGGNGNYTYSWSSNPGTFSSSNANITVSPSVTTTYTCAVSDGTLNASANVVVTVKATPDAQISNLLTTYCSNEGLVMMTATPSGGTFAGAGVSGANFNPSQAVIGINPITYSVTAANGCSDTDTILVDVKAAPSAYAGADTSLPCQNGGVQLGQQPFSGVSYTWYPNLGLNNPNIANPYSTPKLWYYLYPNGYSYQWMSGN